MALIALCVGEDRLGLLQLNDRRKGRFTAEAIALWERLAGYLAVALAKTMAEEKVRQGEERLRLALHAAGMGWWHWDLNQNVLTANDQARDIFGLPPTAELSFDLLLTFLLPEDRPVIERELAESLGSPGDREIEFRISKRDGSIRWLSAKGRALHDGGTPRHLMGVVQDITERKAAEANQALLTNILQALNRGDDQHALIGEILRLIRDATGFDAVGLRLRQGEDCPYFEHDGFTEEFLREENFLCERRGDGAILRDAEGRVVLECTCGLVLSGQTDPSMSCFTAGGSFWTNVSTELLALPRQADPRINPRNRCIHAGYQSVGLFPVRAGEEIIGLLQLNDRREGRFTPELIAFYEALAQNIGLALQRMAAEVAVRQKEAELRDAQRVAHVGSWYWDAKTDATVGSDELLRIYGLDPTTQRMPAFREQDGWLYPHESWQRLNAAVQETLQTGVGYELDVQAIRNGAAIWITTRGEACGMPMAGSSACAAPSRISPSGSGRRSRCGKGSGSYRPSSMAALPPSSSRTAMGSSSPSTRRWSECWECRGKK